MSRPKMMTYTFQISISEVWVADGCNPTAEQIKDAIRQAMLGYSHEDEVRVKLVKDADQKAVAKAQGFKSLAEMVKVDGPRSRRTA